MSPNSPHFYPTATHQTTTKATRLFNVLLHPGNGRSQLWLFCNGLGTFINQNGRYQGAALHYTSLFSTPWPVRDRRSGRDGYRTFNNSIFSPHPARGHLLAPGFNAIAVCRPACRPPLPPSMVFLLHAMTQRYTPILFHFSGRRGIFNIGHHGRICSYLFPSWLPQAH
ncbi:MAG: hypothetical protein HC804_02360 [Anaerolineae bacterium]|nr:hypothetical protein [Anaerolineae bacterium]